jgi:hypothetical protein
MDLYYIVKAVNVGRTKRRHRSDHRKTIKDMESQKGRGHDKLLPKTQWSYVLSKSRWFLGRSWMDYAYSIQPLHNYKVKEDMISSLSRMSNS